MPESSLISYLIVGFLGAILGSFLLHEYDNYGKTNNRLKLRSRCDHCGEQLKFKILFQSFLFLCKRGNLVVATKN